jgi:hypothetical protein
LLLPIYLFSSSCASSGMRPCRYKPLWLSACAQGHYLTLLHVCSS